MNEIEKAIDSAMHSINMLLKKDKIDYENYKTLRDALKEKAERDKMRCENCTMYTDNINDKALRNGFCTRLINYNFNATKPTDFCSYFEPKESEGNNAKNINTLNY